jgi:uncharacterized protein YkwD
MAIRNGRTGVGVRRWTIIVVSSVLALGLLPAGAEAATHGSTGQSQQRIHRTLPPAHRRHGHASKHEPNYAWQMFRATNRTRLRLGLPRYQLDRVKSRIARDHCLAMARQHRLFHTPDVSQYLRGVGRWSGWAENIGWTTGGINALQRAFMGSPDHRPHIVSGLYRHVAVGAVKVNGKIWVSIFFYG